MLAAMAHVHLPQHGVLRLEGNSAVYVRVHAHIEMPRPNFGVVVPNILFALCFVTPLL